MTDEWLLMKRGLFYMPNDCGYTGIKDQAGRYGYDEARAREGNGVTMVHLSEAPEFTTACFDDLARDHLTKQRDEARADNERLRAAIKWALGEAPDDNGAHFGDEATKPHEGPFYGRYWWRKTLRRMAGMGDLAYEKERRTIVSAG